MPEGTASNRDAPPSERTHDGVRVRRIAYSEHEAKERYAVGLLLRSASDGVARKTHALELLADRTRGASQATVYKALQALEKERAIFSDLEGRLDTVDESDWDSFKMEALRALDAVRDPEEDEPAARPPAHPPARRPRPTDAAAAAKKQ
ncbi:hypothetical protein LZC95_44640 [Pendulispora brunnea]|uniref:Uncharacterized protein n=1 Tax=Pendulispora brunnea TaxID=2905690 RepID=A0ABZ2K622_9BACT